MKIAKCVSNIHPIVGSKADLTIGKEYVVSSTTKTMCFIHYNGKVKGFPKCYFEIIEN